MVINLPSSLGSPIELFHRDTADRDGRHKGLPPGKLGAVASESSICSQHGVEMLKMGGNAADAVRRGLYIMGDTED